MRRFRYPVDTDQFQQIREDGKGYTIPYESDGRKVTKCGVRIFSEARNIVHWRSTDEAGNVVDEQTFSIC